MEVVLPLDLYAAHSLIDVLPIKTAPAARNLAATAESRAERYPKRQRDPAIAISSQ